MKFRKKKARACLDCVKESFLHNRKKHVKSKC